MRPGNGAARSIRAVELESLLEATRAENADLKKRLAEAELRLRWQATALRVLSLPGEAPRDPAR